VRMTSASQIRGCDFAPSRRAPPSLQARHLSVSGRGRTRRENDRTDELIWTIAPRNGDLHDTSPFKSFRLNRLYRRRAAHSMDEGGPLGTVLHTDPAEVFAELE